MSPEQRTFAACRLFGWQGGTIHQVAQQTGCDVQSILYGEPESDYIGSAYSLGWSAARTCTVEENQQLNFPQSHGDLDFWLGAIRGMHLKLSGI